MKQEATNTFADGLNMDLNPLTTPNTVMTNALNATLITFNGNEFVLQNDLGNGRVETAYLPSGFVPVGVKEYGGIIYVASYNPQTREGQLGSFPSPEQNLTQDEIDNKQISVDVSQFQKDGEIYYYYKRYDIMPEGTYLNPGDKFGLFIDGSPYDILSFFSAPNYRIVTFHPAVIDEFGKVNYIDDECKIDGTYQRGLIWGEAPSLGTVDGIREAFNKCLVYKGKRFGRLSLIVELETLEDFIVSRSISSSRNNEPKVTSIGSTGIGFSDNQEDTKTEDTQDVSFIVKFYCAGWPKSGNDYLDFTGVKFEGNGQEALYKIEDPDKSMMFAWGGFKKGEGDDTILKYKITPYTQLGPCSALARTGIINFNLLGTGNIILNEWRYYVDNNSIRINYGFDINLLEGESVESVTFTFYDVFFDKVYTQPFVCSSTINGNFNGSYNETFTFPYDLKYTDIYKRDVDNHDYIYTEVLGGEDGETKLKSNQLIKNNFYLVKITIRTKGLVTTDGKNDQTSIKEFYRFMYTTGIFNQQYIEGEIMNFSTIKVDPYDVRLKATTLDGEGDTNLQIDYISGVETNSNERDIIQLCAPSSPNREELENSIHKANLYEDWRITNAAIRLVGEIENIDSQSILTGSYYTFGEYNSGWLEIDETKVTNDNLEIFFDESNQEVLNKNGIPSDDVVNYIQYKADGNDEEIYNFEDLVNNSNGSLTSNDAINILGSTKYEDDAEADIQKALQSNNTTSLEAAQNKIDKSKELKDTRFYYLNGNNVSVLKEEETKTDPTIKLNNILGRLIRRVGGNGIGSEKELSCKEVRPCFYPGMSQDELQFMLGLSSLSGNNISNSNPKALKFQGTYDGDEPYYITIGDPSTLADTSLEEIIVPEQKPDGDDYTLSFDSILSYMSDNMGGLLQHSFIIPICTATGANIEEDERHKYAALSIGNKALDQSKFYMDKCFTGNKGSNFIYWRFYDRSTPTTVVAMCRMDSSTESKPKYCCINLAGSGYSDFINYTQEALSKIYILQKEIQRLLYVKYPSRIGYSSVYNTKINVGISLGNESELGIKIVESPVRLYKSADGTTVDKGDFSKANIIKNLLANTDFVSEASDDNIPTIINEKDVWYTSAEEYSPNEKPSVLQCSWLNIPFPAIDEEHPDKDNKDGREDIVPDDGYSITINPPYPVNFILDDLVEKDGEYYLSSNIELGGNIDPSLIVDEWNNLINNMDSYVPTYQFIPGTSLEDFEIGGDTDASGSRFNTNQVYYLSLNNKLLGGNSEYIKNASLFDNNKLGGSHTCYQRMLIPSNDSNERYRVPVINSYKGSRTEVITMNLNKGGPGDNDESGHILKGFSFYIDAFFDITNSGIYRRNNTSAGSEPTS